MPRLSESHESVQTKRRQKAWIGTRCRLQETNHLQSTPSKQDRNQRSCKLQHGQNLEGPAHIRCTWNTLLNPVSHHINHQLLLCCQENVRFNRLELYATLPLRPARLSMNSLWHFHALILRHISSAPC